MNVISAAFPYQKQRRRALGREMTYVELGEGDPIVLLHGNSLRRGATFCCTCNHEAAASRHDAFSA